MHKFIFRVTPEVSVLFIILNIGFSLLGANSYQIEYEKTKKLFLNPPREYANAPLWVWNDMLTEEQIVSTLRDLASQNVKQVFVHPRPGLMTPYLSKEWFKLWKTAINEAKRLDMNVWIYDENSYPSGFAGGWVPELMPESRGRGLYLKESSTPPKWSTNVIGIYRIDKDSCDDITTDIIRGKQFPQGSYLTAYTQRAGNSPWHGNRCYVDLLYPGVTEKFLQITLDAYKKHFGNEFGKRIPGSFTDEPQLRPAGGFPWTDDLNMRFMKRWGYSLYEVLPLLYKEVGDWQKVRHNYYATLLDLFIERWAKPYYEYCSSNRLEFTGHYWEHEWPNCGMVPDNMAMAAWQHRPGIDILMNHYEEHTHAQFGNIRSCKEISSIANQLGRKRTIVELYGAGGWDLRFEDMKRIGDWLLALGVNTLDEHLSYISIRGERKHDHPQSFSYHEPWWDSYNLIATYFKRVSATLSQGEQINKILVIEPTTTAWMYQGNQRILNDIGQSFFNFLKELESNQIEYDIGCEDVIARHGAVKDNEFKVGNRFYHTVVIPPISSSGAKAIQFELNLNRSTFLLLERFAVNGGRVISCAPPLERIDGSRIPQLSESLLTKNTQTMDKQRAIDTLKSLQEKESFYIVRDENDKGILFHHRRVLSHGEIIFLVNTSLDYPSRGTVVTKKGIGFQEWDPVMGKFKGNYRKQRENREHTYYFELPPGGSLMLYMEKELVHKTSLAEISQWIFTTRGDSTIYEEVPQVGKTEICRMEQNVLTIDYVDIAAGGETLTNVYFYRANQFAFKKNGMERNPWDSAVQFKDELIKIKFPDNSGFTVSYKFTIASDIPKDLEIVVETPKIYRSILCNGTEIKADAKKWWLDKSFARIPIAKYARSGLNVVTLEAAPMTIYHEIEPAYVLGSFKLKPVEKGFVIIKDGPIQMYGTNGSEVATDKDGDQYGHGQSIPEYRHENNPDGTMWLTAGIGFENTPESKDKTPYIVFDLGEVTNLSGIKIWNYNENHVRNLTNRGVKRMRIFAGTMVKSGLEYNLGEFTLEKSDGTKTLPQFIKAECKNVRFVKFDILENHAGVVFPPINSPLDNGFVGLAEVKFVNERNQTIKGVTLYDFSSQLVSHNRLAKNVIDNSGLDSLRGGWDTQGHPFYANGFSYIQKFIVTNLSANYKVLLTNWRGSVAKIYVNNKFAGLIGFSPYECDVTRFIKYGENKIEVVVLGTLKNTLGPHHGNPGLGSAWPSMFHNAPQNGPPAGVNYHTVSYGLFEPFKLLHVKK